MSCRLFALGRMVETLLFNVARIHSLWPTFLNHLMEVLGNQKIAVRIAGLDALAKATSGILLRIIKAGPDDPGELIIQVFPGRLQFQSL